MRIINFASGSKGNSTLVILGETHLLIDCGISFRRLQDGLRAAGIGLDAIQGVIITHLHTDHVSGLPVWFRRSNLRFLVPEPVARRTAAMAGAGRGDGRFTFFRNGESWAVGDIELSAFAVSHDAPETVGLRFCGGGEGLAYLTDLGTVPDELAGLLEHQSIIFLESNHEPALVAGCTYPEATKRRILGPKGHLSNQQALELLRGLSSPPHTVVFGHLSENNNSPDILAARLDEWKLESRIERIVVASQRRFTDLGL